jgi:hypothetical protein
VGAARPNRDLAESVRRFEAGLTAGVDHSLGRVFVEEAQEDLARHPDGGAAVAQAIADAVLPRYVAVLGNAPPAPPPVTPKVTVTLVRWPYT